MQKAESVNDNSKSIISSAQRFISGTMLSRIAGLGRDVSMAAVFGAEPAIAALMVAFRLSNLLRRLFGEGALQSAFIPHFEDLRLKSSTAAAQFFADLSRTLTFLLLILLLLGEGVVGGFLQWGSLSADNAQVLKLMAIIFPSILFICHYGLNLSLLQCEKKYFTSAVAPLFFNLVWIATVWAIKDFPIDQAVRLLSLAIVVAYGFQWLITSPGVRKFLKAEGKLRAKALSPEVRRLAMPLGMGIIGVGAAQINSALDCFFARYASLEGPAYLWYSIRMQQLPFALFGIALTSALLPPLARAFKAGKMEQYQEFLSFALRRTCKMLIPCTFAIFALGASSVALLYGRGSFHIHSMEQTTLCLWAYGVGLVPMALSSLLASVHYSQGNFHFPAKVSSVSLCVNLILNSFFVFVMGWGAVSVALATSLSAFINAYLLYRNAGSSELEMPWSFIVRVLLCSACAMLLTVYLIGEVPLVGIFGFRAQLWAFTWQAVCFFISLLGLGFIFLREARR